MKKIIGLTLILATTFLASCQENAADSKANTEITADKKNAMSGCDATCITSCCTYPDKETGGCLCAKKDTDCTAHCCAAHEKGDKKQDHRHGGMHNHNGQGHGHGNHKHDTLTAK